MNVLIVLIIISGNPTVSMQEFSSRDACQDVGKTLRDAVGTDKIRWWCAQK
jgi:hypothetical protein